MKPEEILSQFLKKEKRILHLGGDSSLKDLTDADQYTQVQISSANDLEKIENTGFDYVILSDVLELVEDPQEVIKQAKNMAKSTIIYEFKYDEDCVVDPSWKQTWKTVGLEFFLTREFDWVNDIYLGYATIHICEMPYNGGLLDKETPDAIR